MNTYVTSNTIRQLRENRGLTQAELADQLGVSSKTISKWETAKGLPDISLLQPLARALGISVIELMDGEHIINRNRSANMLRSKFYVCPLCGNVIHSIGDSVISCCGITLPALEPETPEDTTEPTEPEEPTDPEEPEEQIKIIVSVLARVKAKFEADVNSTASVDIDKRCIEIIDYLKEKASQVVYTLTKRIAKEKAIKLMEEVGIPEARIRYRQYPFEFSGGMRQRIVIAIALSANPDILICDEPTTALDVTIQAQILELINKLKRERELSIIFITHDLGVVANMADRIAVMYAGKIVEYGTANEVFYDPQHPYTWALLSSMPDLDTNEKLDAIPGTPPNMIYPPVGDAFAERNKYAMQIDFEMQPPMFEVSPTHFAATWLLHPNAPKVKMPKIITERIKRMEERGGQHAE